MKTRTYMYKTAVYGSPIKAAILKTEKGLNVVLRPRCSFDLQATFLQISVCVCQCVCMSFCPVLSLFTHILHRHTPTHAKIYPCWGRILISLSDSLLALHPNGLVLHRTRI